MNDNPYASPDSSLQFDLQGSTGYTEKIGVDGRDLMVRTKMRLPSFCVKTNAPITEDEIRVKAFTWYPRWVLALILLNLLIMLIAYLITKKTCILLYGLSPEVRARIRNRVAIKILITLALLCVAIALTASDHASASLVAWLLFAVSLIVALLGNSTLWVVKHKDGVFWIRGCSDEFLARIANAAPEPESFL